MKMNARFQRQIDFLLENACSSIKYLVYRDLLGELTAQPEMKQLQEQILSQPNVQKHFAAQHEDGWFGHELHGTDGMDGHISGLLRLGVESTHGAIRKALVALTTPEISCAHKNYFRGGDALDAEQRGGNRAVIAGILASVGAGEDTPVYAEQIALAFEHLMAVSAYSSVDDFTVKGKSARYYKPKSRFPGANHIGILEASTSWRTGESMAAAKAAARHAYELMRDFDEPITFKKPREFGSGFVGPFNYNWQALSPLTREEIAAIITGPYNFGFAFWLGAIGSVPDWVLQHKGTYEVLADMLESGEIFGMMTENALRAFRKVSGREPTYRKKHAAECDITFAVLSAVWRRV